MRNSGKLKKNTIFVNEDLTKLNQLALMCIRKKDIRWSEQSVGFQWKYIYITETNLEEQFASTSKITSNEWNKTVDA